MSRCGRRDINALDKRVDACATVQYVSIESSVDMSHNSPSGGANQDCAGKLSVILPLHFEQGLLLVHAA